MTPFVEDGILFGRPDLVLPFVLARLPHVRDFGNCTALGIARDERLIGGIVFNNWHPGVDIEMTVAMDTAAWWRPRTVRRVLAHGFSLAPRITLRTGRKNKAARRCALATGFCLEGVKRRALDGRQDQIFYGLLREECRFLKER